MQTIGEKLKKARLEKGASLDDVYRQTKIHPHVLEALEQGRADDFLSALYIKGFLRSYACYLGLDGEQILKEYIDGKKKGLAPDEPIVEKKTRFSKGLNLLAIFRVVAVIVLSFVFIFYFRFALKRISILHQPPIKEDTEVKTAPALAVRTEGLVLQVKALDTCWMRVKTDGEAVFEKTLAKGRNERWRAKSKIELRIGKPEALEVVVNGRPVDLKKLKVKRSLTITQNSIFGK